MSSPATPATIKRQLRHSNPTPPEKSDIKRNKTEDNMDMLSQSESDDLNVTFERSHPSVGIQSSLTDYDIERIASAVESRISVNLRNMVERIVDNMLKPIRGEMQLLQNENRRLKYKLDDLEQYGRRSLVRVSGITEKPGEDTTKLVCKLFAEIDPEFSDSEVERSHRNGPPPPSPAPPAAQQPDVNADDQPSLPQASANVETVPEPPGAAELSTSNESTVQPKPRQIMVRVTNPSVKLRILKCRKNLKKSSNFSNVYINEDLTRLRSKLFWHVRQIAKNASIKQYWTTNGKIFVKDVKEKIHSIQSTEDFNLVTALTGIRYTFLSLDNL